MNDLLSAEYLFQGKFGRVEDIYTYAFIYYNLSAVPKGGGGLWSFPYMPIILAVPLVVHRHIYALHHPPHHHIQREERQPHRHVIHTPLRPNDHISIAKSITIVLPYRPLWTQSAVFQYIGRSVYEPKRVTSPLFR